MTKTFKTPFHCCGIDYSRIYFLFMVVLILFLFVPVGAESDGSGKEGADKDRPFGLVIHGGAGFMTADTIPPEKAKLYRAKLKEALGAGYKVLEAGGTSLDAVETAIVVLEDCPLFNAGKGAVFTHEGANELDSSIMCGKTRNAGAVAGVKRIKNPIRLARLVMEKSPHVLMAREGAEFFAKEQGMAWVPEKYFYTEKQFKRLQRVKSKQKGKPETPPIKKKGVVGKMGTVGCAALDKHGNLAAGTSTGGMTNKRFGRVGDSPIIGAGTFADNETCAISATGHGEFFIRWVVAYDISALMKYKGMSLKEAADLVVNKKLRDVKGAGGIIAIDKHGNVATPFNTKGMFRAYIDKTGTPTIKIFQ